MKIYAKTTTKICKQIIVLKYFHLIDIVQKAIRYIYYVDIS